MNIPRNLWCCVYFLTSTNLCCKCSVSNCRGGVSHWTQGWRLSAFFLASIQTMQINHRVVWKRCVLRALSERKQECTKQTLAHEAFCSPATRNISPFSEKWWRRICRNGRSLFLNVTFRRKTILTGPKSSFLQVDQTGWHWMLQSMTFLYRTQNILLRFSSEAHLYKALEQASFGWL